GSGSSVRNSAPRSHMDRVLEPELMTDEDQALACPAADFPPPNQAFVDRFIAFFPDFTRGIVADLGCGPADIPIRLCRALPGVTVTAVDGSDPRRRPAAGAGAAARRLRRRHLQ